MAADEWLMNYNEYRPHESLGDMPPAAFLPRTFERNVSSFKSSTWQGSLRPGSTNPWPKKRTLTTLPSTKSVDIRCAWAPLKIYLMIVPVFRKS